MERLDKNETLKQKKRRNSVLLFIEFLFMSERANRFIIGTTALFIVK
jgi:hypothetical protein